ncbi:MAG: sporulation integral membrane protein YtvI [Lachnospiraceae bacterium]|mgnify:FL=1|nr:sporulation integral membrane protein YtvI [Lachnospiraceae bacterium]
MQKVKVYLQILTNLLLTAVLMLLIIFVLPKLLRFFMPFVIGFIISLIANPVVKFMEKKIKIVRKHGSAIIIVLVLASVVGLIYLAVSLIIHEAVSLVQDIPNIVNAVTAFFDTLSKELSGVLVKLPEGLQKAFGNINATITEYVTEFVGSISLPTLSDAGSYVKNIANFFLQFIITILASYFIIAEQDKLAVTVSRIVPESVKKTWHLVTDNFRNAVGGYFKAQFKIMWIITLILFVVFEILHVNYSFLLALLIAFLDLLPVFGTGTVLGPWIVVDIVNGNYKRAIVLAFLYLGCLLVKQLLQPKMVGDSIGVSPFAALIFMFVGYQFSGVVGMILGIPVGMVLISFYRLGMFDRLIRGFKIIATDLNNFRKF